MLLRSLKDRKPVRVRIAVVWVKTRLSLTWFGKCTVFNVLNNFYCTVTTTDYNTFWQVQLILLFFLHSDASWFFCGLESDREKFSTLHTVQLFKRSGFAVELCDKKKQRVRVKDHRDNVLLQNLFISASEFMFWPCLTYCQGVSCNLLFSCLCLMQHNIPSNQFYVNGVNSVFWLWTTTACWMNKNRHELAGIWGLNFYLNVNFNKINYNKNAFTVYL